MQEFQVKQGLDAQAVLSILLRQKWIVLITFLTFAGVVSYYSLSKPTQYVSSAVLYFDNSTKNPVLDILGKNAGLRTLDIGYYDILMSTDHFKRRLRSELQRDLLDQKGQTYVDHVADLIGQSSVNLRSYKETNQFIEIAGVSTDSFLVRRLVDVATNLLKTRAAELDREDLDASIQFIDDQIEVTKTNLEKTELALQALKKKTDAIAGEAEGPLNKIILMKEKLAELETQVQIRSSNLQALNAQLDSIQRRMTGQGIGPGKESQDEKRLKTQIEDLQARKAAILQRAGGGNDGELERIDADIVKLREQYVTLLSSYTPSSELSTTGDLNELWKSIFTKKNNEEVELFILKAQARLYSGLIRNFELKNPNLLQDAIDMTRLNRSKQVFEETLNSLIKQKENFSIQMFGTTGNLKIVDPAKPPIAIYRNVYTTILVGSMLGLLIGVALAFGIEYLDTTIRNQEAISAITNIPVIGFIPPIEPEVSNNGAPSLKEQLMKKIKRETLHEDEDKNLLRKRAMISQFNPRSFVSESYRTLRTNIQFANIDSPIQSIVIGSSGPGEGKTTTAVNLAISFADMGLQVCLVDADLRKPKHHILFDIQDSQGLADCILAGASVEGVIKPTRIKNLKLLTNGTNALNHPEIFSSMKMRQLMDDLKGRFDMVIYDTPPILLLTDSIILSSRVDGVILVVKHGLTERASLQEAISALKNVRANILGIMFNGYVTERKGYYRYAREQYYQDTIKEETSA